MDYEGLQGCQVGDVGVAIIIAVVTPDGDPVDVSAAASKKIRLGYPGGVSKDFDAGFDSDGTDGKISYTTQSGDLDEAGEYSLQGIIVLGGTTKYTSVSTLQVRENIPEPVTPPES